MILIKRIYAKNNKNDGFRILVDRLWPRGVSKARAKIDLWVKEIAPSNELRHWFAHKPENWGEFRKKYLKELEESKALLEKIREIEKEKGSLTLLFAARNEEFNNAVVLKEALEKK